MKDQFQAILKAFGGRRRSALSDPTSLRAILDSGLLDPRWYARQRPELPSVLDLALGHYLEVGWRSGLDPGPDFSTLGYLATNPEVAASGMNPLLHYLRLGRMQGRSRGVEPDGTNSRIVAEAVLAEFDADFYRREHADVAKLGFSPLSHFLHRGWKEGRDPHPQFSVKYYLANNPDVREAHVNPYYHYLVAGRREGRIPNPAVAQDPHLVAVRAVVAREFDARHYLAAYPDVRTTGMDALTHYLEVGWKEGLDPNAEFSTSFYVREHPDVREAVIEPFYHYLSEGRREGRAIAHVERDAREAELEVRNTIASEFDSDFYLAQYPDIARAGVDPISHYVKYGWREGRDPHPRFSTSYYLETYADIRDAGINPFYHFVIAGRTEGRQPFHPGGWKAKALTLLQSVPHRIGAAPTIASDTDLGEGIVQELCRVLERSATHFLLSVSQDNYTASVGGVQLCIKIEEAAAAEEDHHYLNLHPTRAIPFLSRASDPSEIELGVVLDGNFLGSLPADKIVSVLGKATRAGATCDLVVHSLLGHSPEVIVSMYRSCLPARSLFWLHDYFSVCPSFTLLRNEISYCGAPSIESTGCSICVFGEERRSHLDRIHGLFARIPFKVISPSEVAKSLWLQSARLPHEDASVQAHCRIEWHEDCAQTASSGPMRVAFVGHPANHKGWQTFVRLLDEHGRDPRYEFHHLASGARQHSKARFTKVSVIDDGATAMTESLAALEIDAVLVWSIWPETFSFVAHEALSSGAVLLTCRESGNVAHLAEHSLGSVIFEDEQALVDAFRSEDLYMHLLSRREHGIKRGEMSFGKMSGDVLARSRAAQ